MRRNMMKIAEDMSGKIPKNYDMSCIELMQLCDEWHNGQPFKALCIAFRYGFALALRMEANRRKKAGESK